MAVNKNFVVKNGLEVNTDLLFADSVINKIGIGSTTPVTVLDVKGGIAGTDLQATGFTTLTKDLQVGASGSAFYVSNTNNLVGVGTSVPAYLMDIRSSVSTGQTALYVKGDMRVTGDINLDDLTIDDLKVTGVATFVGDGSSGLDSWIDIDYSGNTLTGGGTTVGIGSTVYFVDNAKAVFGAGQDLTIGHVGGSSKIENVTGDLNIVSSNNVKISHQSSGEDYAVFNEDGAVDLYYNGTRRLATTHGGVVVAGGSSITGISTVLDATQARSTATGALQVSGGAGIEKNLFVGGGAQVTGVTTITGTLDANGALDVDGHTELDDVNVAGAATFAGAIDINSTSDFNGVVTVSNTTQSSSKDTGAIIVEGGAGIEKNLFVGGGAQVTGVTTITGTLDANGALDVDGHTELDDVNVAGASTFAGAADFNGAVDVDGHTELDDVNVSGASTFAGAIDANATTQSSASTNGAATFAGGVGVAKNLFVGGGAQVSVAFTVGSGIGVTTILDQDDMAANSATALASQQSIKAYVDSTTTAQDLDFAGDSGTGAVDLDSQSLTISGTASEIKTVASGQSLTVSLPDDVIVGNALTVTGIGSFYNDVKFAGPTGVTSLTWDKSAGDLKFEDNAKAKFGTGGDLEIYHDSVSNNSFIKEGGSGNLYIYSANLRIENADGSDSYIEANDGGATELYWDGTKKFETGPAGTITVGVSTATTFSVGDGSHSTDRISIGDNNDLALYHNGSNSFVVDRGTGPLYIRGNTAVRIESYTNDAAGEPMIIANSDSSVDIYYDNVVKFATSGVGATVYGTGALNIPVGTTAERPTLGNSPVNGDIRYNTTLNSYEGYGNGAWGGLGGGTEIDNDIATTTATGISTFVKTDYRSAYFRLQITQGSAYQVGRYLLIHDGTTATLVEESAIATGSMLGDVTAAVSGSNVIIYINMGSSSSATITHIIDKITV